MLELTDFTICAAASANVALTSRALQISMAQCKFGDAVLFSNERVGGAFRTVEIDRISSIADYQIFRLRQLPRLVDTPFILNVEWDGYIVDPRAWRPIFREYDYIGAKWPHALDDMRVGNSGFCLQSKKLFEALADPRFEPAGGENVDKLICRTFRPVLERDYGIRFAPESVADLFSYENHVPDQPTFGFHGCGNMWRCHDDASVIEIVELLDPYLFSTDQFARLLVHYGLQQQLFPLERIYATMRKHVTAGSARRSLRRVAPPGVADDVFALCERLGASLTGRTL